eukprot:SAG31_NODE_14591_length_797_cov_5.481375_2_plen_24_part_01
MLSELRVAHEAAMVSLREREEAAR